MPQNPTPPRITRENGFVTDPESGLQIPQTYQRIQTNIDTVLNENLLGGTVGGKGYSRGYALERDADSLIVRWPEKGSGWDDYVNQSIVDGTIANVGIAPVVASQISSMVKRQELQAATATIALSGRRSPALKARDAIARFNDSPMGATMALQRIAYQVCTYNRGSPIATVPITYSLDKWGAFGMEAIPLMAPLVGKQRKQRESDLAYLAVDWEKHGTPVPFLPSVYDLEPSGIAEWPFWYRAKDSNNLPKWVLLHQTHILEMTPGVSARPGLGTSPVWACLDVLAEQILVLEARAEQSAYSLTDGITLLGGVEGKSGAKILDRIKTSRADALTRGLITSKGQTILTSPMAEKVSIAQVSFRQNLTEFKDWREYVEDIIVFNFGETLTAMVMRGGVGYGAQAATGAENTADSGIGAVLSVLSATLGAIYDRVQVVVSRPNDRAQRLNIKALVDFATAAGGKTGMIAHGVFSPQEARAIIDRDILSIPVLSDDTVTVTPNSDDPSVSSTKNTAPLVSPVVVADQAAAKQKSAPRKVAAGREQRPWHPDMDFDGAVSAGLVDVIWPNEAMKARDEALYKDGPVVITESDSDRAIRLAGVRIGSTVQGLLTAEKE